LPARCPRANSSDLRWAKCVASQEKHNSSVVVKSQSKPTERRARSSTAAASADASDTATTNDNKVGFGTSQHLPPGALAVGAAHRDAAGESSTYVRGTFDSDAPLSEIKSGGGADTMTFTMAHLHTLALKKEAARQPLETLGMNDDASFSVVDLVNIDCHSH
jgi:hypothetical protein